MAVEDAAALATSLSLAISQPDTPHALALALDVWQTERIKRTSQMAHASLINGILWHFPDGREQRARDEGMRPEVEQGTREEVERTGAGTGTSFVKSPNQWSDTLTQRWCYGYDAEREVEIAWELRRGGV